MRTDSAPVRTDVVGRDRGQATVEFALTLPLVAIVLAVIVQLTSIATARLEIVTEASRTARAASMSENPDEAARRALVSTSSSVEVSFDDETVTVTVSRRIETNVAIIGRFVPSVDVRTSLTMAREPTN